MRTPGDAADLAERGVTVRRLDYDEPASLPGALAGADKVLLISSSQVGRRVPQHQTVVDAASAEGVSLLAYTSVLHAATSPLHLAAEHLATERIIARSGLASTILRNGWYMENYTENLAPALQHGTLIGSAGDGSHRRRHPCRLRRRRRGRAHRQRPRREPSTSWPANRSRWPTSPPSCPSRSAARSATPTCRQAEYRAALTAAGVPDAFAELLVDADVNIANGWLDAPATTLAALIGRPTTPLPVAIRAALSPVG